MTFIAVEIMAFAAFFIGQALISGRAPTATLGRPGLLRALTGAGLYGVLIVLLALALGTILRSAVGAISVLVTLLFALPEIAAALPSSIKRTVEKHWLTEAGQQVHLGRPRRPYTATVDRPRRPHDFVTIALAAPAATHSGWFAAWVAAHGASPRQD